MSADIQALPEFRWPGVFGVLRSFWRTLPQAEKVAAPIAGPDPILVQEVSEVACSVGLPLLGATSRQDLLALADEAIESQSFQRARLVLLEVTRALPLSSLEDALAPEPSQELTEVLGTLPARDLLQGLAPMLKAGAAAYLQLLSHLPDEAVRNAMMESASYLFSEALPLELRRLLLDTFRAEILSLAVVAAVEQDKPLASWLSFALVEFLLEGERSRLRILASIPGVFIPFEVIPAADRLDGVALQESVRGHDALIASWADAAEKSGEDPFFPFGAPGDEEG